MDVEEADAEDEEALPEEVTAVVPAVVVDDDETYVITIGLYPGADTTPLLMIEWAAACGWVTVPEAETVYEVTSRIGAPKFIYPEA